MVSKHQSSGHHLGPHFSFWTSVHMYIIKTVFSLIEPMSREGENIFLPLHCSTERVGDKRRWRKIGKGKAEFIAVQVKSNRI